MQLQLIGNPEMQLQLFPKRQQLIAIILLASLSRNLLIRAADYDTVQQRTIIPIQEMKAAEMEMRKMRMVRMPNMDGEEEFRRMNPDSSAGIYVTASVEAQCRLIAQKRKIQEGEKIKNTKLNDLKRAARINQRAKSFTKLVANLPNETMASENAALRQIGRAS